MTFQVIPPQSQPIDEQSADTMDRTWFRFFHSLFQNALTFIPVPNSATATGIAGQLAYDSNFLYVCVSTNSWKRTALSSF